MTRRTSHQAEVLNTLGVLHVATAMRQTFGEAISGRPEKLAMALYALDVEAAGIVYRQLGKLLRKSADKSAVADGKAVTE